MIIYIFKDFTHLLTMAVSTSCIKPRLLITLKFLSPGHAAL